MEQEVKLSVGKVPLDTDKYIIVNVGTGEEFVVNEGLTLKIVEKDGTEHKFGWDMSADSFFRAITEHHDNMMGDSIVASIVPVAWGDDSKFNLKNTKKRDGEAFDKHFGKK